MEINSFNTKILIILGNEDQEKLGKMNKLIHGKWKIHSFCPELSRSARVILEIRKGQEIRIINVNLKPSKEYSNSSV